VKKVHDWISSGATPAPFFIPPAAGDQLAAFYEWYCTNGPSCPMAPESGLAWAGNLPGIVIYRAGQFQVQMFVFPAGCVVPPHRHPGVDTIEAHVAGHYDFRVNGTSAIPLDHLHDRRGTVSRWWGRGVRVRPSDWHDLSVFETGACFLSIQHWLRGAPSSVGEDWEGRAANSEHEALLCR